MLLTVHGGAERAVGAALSLACLGPYFTRALKRGDGGVLTRPADLTIPIHFFPRTTTTYLTNDDTATVTGLTLRFLGPRSWCAYPNLNRGRYFGHAQHTLRAPLKR